MNESVTEKDNFMTSRKESNSEMDSASNNQKLEVNESNEPKETQDVNESFASSNVSTWSQVVHNIKALPSYQYCQDFINNLGERVHVWTDIESAKQFLSETSTPLLKKVSEVKESTFEFASNQWESTLKKTQENEYVMLLTSKYTEGVTTLKNS